VAAGESLLMESLLMIARTPPTGGHSGSAGANRGQPPVRRGPLRTDTHTGYVQKSDLPELRARFLEGVWGTRGPGAWRRAAWRALPVRPQYTARHIPTGTGQAPTG